MKFRDFLREFNLCAPQTFDGYHAGPLDVTWKSPNGWQRRIDFIAVPVAWRADGFESKILGDLDVVVNKRDHYPADLRATVHFKMHETLVQRRKPIMQNPANGSLESII